MFANNDKMYAKSTLSKLVNKISISLYSDNRLKIYIIQGAKSFKRIFYITYNIQFNSMDFYKMCFVLGDFVYQCCYF